MESIVLPKTLKFLGYRALGDYKKLKSIELPNGLERICKEAFYDAKELKEITIPASVKQVEDYAFRFSGLTKLRLESVETDFKEDALGNTNVTEIGLVNTGVTSSLLYISRMVHVEKVTNIGDNVTELPQWAFNGWENLKSLEIPKNLERISTYAFGHTKFKSLDFRETKLEEIETSAFRECEELETILFPDSFSKIGICAFVRCKALKELDLHNTRIERISSSQFEGCDNLERLVLPKRFEGRLTLTTKLASILEFK